jgi:hypothetical protein
MRRLDASALHIPQQVGCRRRWPGHRAADRDDVDVRIGCEASVEPQLLVAIVVPAFQRRGVEEVELHRLMGKPLIEAGVSDRIPVRRAGTADEIARSVVLLVSNAYMTGQTIAVNGGAFFY